MIAVPPLHHQASREITLSGLRNLVALHSGWWPMIICSECCTIFQDSLSLSLLIQCIKFHWRVIKSAISRDHPHSISSYLHPIFIHPVAGMTRNQATRKLLYWPWDVRQMLRLSDCRLRLISPKIAMDLLHNCWIWAYCHTVHGQNPAPVGMVQTPWFIGYLLSQLFGFCFRWSWKVAKKCFWRWNSMLRLVICGNSAKLESKHSITS